MKKKIVIAGMATILICAVVSAAPYTFFYKFKPGKKYVTTMSSQTETNFMEKKEINRSRTVIEYSIKPGVKKDWILLNARIRSQKDESGQDTGQTMGIYQVTYSADMHVSGEIRNIKYTGAKLSPEMEEQIKSLPPETAALVRQSANFMAEQWKESVFWFPEFTENRLKIGDEFEFTRKSMSGSPGTGMQNQFQSKQVFTLESVRNGLADFSIEERSLLKSGGVMGGQADVKSLGKSKAVFDLRTGIWIELVSKYRSQVQFSGMPGSTAGSESGAQDVFSIIKYEMSAE
ncbi:MAG: hypothetical protein EHM45_06625 [Desulfobacteraceae bacterium]|nr:MAG: hypothetical protein EHM45_06625 [Desulfobacteraceae bacterium]